MFSRTNSATWLMLACTLALAAGVVAWHAGCASKPAPHQPSEAELRALIGKNEEEVRAALGEPKTTEDIRSPLDDPALPPRHGVITLWRYDHCRVWLMGGKVIRTSCDFDVASPRR